MNSKEKILFRLTDSNSAPAELTLNIPRREALTDPTKQFILAARTLNAEVFELDSISVPAKIKELLGDEEPLLSYAVRELFPGVMGQVFHLPMGKNEVKFFRCGITLPDAALARTGTLVEISQIPGDRLISLIPEIHLAIVRKNSLLNSHYEAFDQLDTLSNVTLITGPSRTADIEKRIVIGAHGPKRLIIFLI